MESQGPVEVGIVAASTLPSLVCFGASAYLLAWHVADGWGWLMLIGVLALELPKQAIRACRPRRRDREAIDQGKPEPLHEEYV